MPSFPAVETVSDVVTSWIALTTGSPPPPACSAAIYSQQGGGELIAFDPVLTTLHPAWTSSCFPAQATAWYNQGGDLPKPTGTQLSTVLSLGPFACPGGYSTAFTTTVKSSTHVACCPSDYVYQGSFVDHGTIGECWSTPTDGATLKYYTLTGTGTWSETSTVLSSTHVVGVQINGWHFAAATTPASTTSSTSSTSSSSSSSSTSSASPSTIFALPGASVTSSPAAVTSSTSPSPGLSSSSKVAIGVGLALGIVGLASLLGVWMLFRRRRQAQQITPAESSALFGSANSPNEVDGHSYYAAQVHEPKEVHGNTTVRAELNGQHELRPVVHQPSPGVHEMS